MATKNFTLPIREEETFDVSISWGQGKWEQTLFEPLMVNETFPVCAPDYFRDRLIDLSSLAPSELIHDRTTHCWRAFLEKAGGQDVNSGFGQIFTQTSLCLESAARGDGVAISDEVSTRAYLQSGALIAPFKDRIPSPDAYYLLQKRTVGTAQDSVAAFRAWVLEKAAKHRIWYSEYWEQK